MTSIRGCGSDLISTLFYTTSLLLVALFLYPVSVAFTGAIFARRRLLHDSAMDSVSLIVPAHSGESVIQWEMENSLGIDAPPKV